MIVMLEPEGSVRQGHLNPVYIPDVEVSHFLVNSIDLCYEIKGYLTPLFNARILFFLLVRRFN